MPEWSVHLNGTEWKFPSQCHRFEQGCRFQLLTPAGVAFVAGMSAAVTNTQLLNGVEDSPQEYLKDTLSSGDNLSDNALAMKLVASESFSSCVCGIFKCESKLCFVCACLLCVRACMYVRVCVCVCMFVYLYMCVCVLECVYIFVCVYVRGCVCLRASSGGGSV